MPRYKGGSRAKGIEGVTTSNLPFTDINPRLVNAQKYDDKLLRQEYRRMRDIAQKRLKRMEGKQEAEWVLEQHPEGFPMTRDLKDRADLVKGLMDVSNFLNAQRSSISGIRETAKKTSEAIRKGTGVTVPKSQLANYGRFMNKMKKELGLKPGTYDSKYMAEVWQQAKNKGKLTKKELREAVLQYLNDKEEYAGRGKKKNLSESDRRKMERKNSGIATRVAHSIDKFFDESDLSKKTISGLKRRRKKK